MADNNVKSGKEKKRLAFKAKGEVGYIDSKKRYELIMTLILFAVAAGIFVLGLALNKWEKGNIFTIIAALFVIPMARYATTYIMFFPFKSVTEAEAAEAEAAAKPGSIIYADYIMTSEKRAMMLAFAVITSDKIIGLTGRKEEDVLDIRNYIQDIVTRRGYDYKVTITDEKSKFLSLLRGSDSAAELAFENDEAKTAFDEERKKLCGELESLMP
ncbi:MAG: hypothetical protein K6F16_07555 [Lachnospiraceae bacterium]|nr:hypothetical protein [Lachnospiraceae bacterium]